MRKKLEKKKERERWMELNRELERYDGISQERERQRERKGDGERYIEGYNYKLQ